MNDGGRRQRARSTILDAIGDFWCEASVLVAVFAILDKLLKHEPMTWSWAVVTVACATISLAMGVCYRHLSRIV